MRESKIEKHLRLAVRRAGGRAYPWKNLRGAPDRIVVWPGGVHFVELKAPGKKPRPEQARFHRELRGLKAIVHAIDTTAEADRYVAKWGRREA